jgi:hypothetical protein
MNNPAPTPAVHTVRIATVNATGRKYIVQQRNSDKVYCWGEVNRLTWRGIHVERATHDKSKVFLESAVTVSEVPGTLEFYKSLWNQYVQVMDEAGRLKGISRTGRTAYIQPKAV